MKPYEPEIPAAELHSPEKFEPESALPPVEPVITDHVYEVGFGVDAPSLCGRCNKPHALHASIPDSRLPSFDDTSFPHGNEFARFHLAGDCDVTIYAPGPGNKTITVEMVTTGSAPFTEGAPDTRRRTVLQLSKARARALASAIMGAAAEL